MISTPPLAVPLFHSLGNGTAEQAQNLRNNQRNTHGTLSLKTLANKVLERNRERNKCRTTTLKPVPLMSQESSACGTNKQTAYEFNERAAIMEYDGGLERDEAEQMARIVIKEQTILLDLMNDC